MRGEWGGVETQAHACMRMCRIHAQEWPALPGGRAQILLPKLPMHCMLGSPLHKMWAGTAQDEQPCSATQSTAAGQAT